MNLICVCCGGDFYPVQDTWMGNVCDECRTPCSDCGDWLENGPEVVSQGKRWHAVCFRDALEEGKAA